MDLPQPFAACFARRFAPRSPLRRLATGVLVAGLVVFAACTSTGGPGAGEAPPAVRVSSEPIVDAPTDDAPLDERTVADEAGAAGPEEGAVEEGVVEENAAEEPLEQLGEADLGDGPEPAGDAVVAEGPEERSAEEILAESLAAYETSGAHWQRGDFDLAFDALDRAYELMSRAEVEEDDPDLARQKEDLRHLVSRRVVEIYASQRTAVGDMDRAIPVEITPEVEREIESFQTRERRDFLAAYQRSGLYRPMIVEVLRERGMPEQLSWLPMVESWFKVRALSRARALGMWQFISSTGYRYGLERGRWVDERMDPEKSTHAAASYLTDLHDLFGDWLLALAAYNSGEGRVMRELDRQREGYFDRFWDLHQRLPRETRRYVPRFLATLAILEDPQAYGFDDLPEPFDPVAVDTMEVQRPVRLEVLDRALGVEAGTLLALNPELRRGSLPDRPYPLRVPEGLGTGLDERLVQLPQWQPPQDSTHRVRRGETLSGIAERYGTSVRQLMAANRLSSANRIYPGQRLRVPGGGGAASSDADALAEGEEVVHVVGRGDSLWRLAARYGTTVERIRRDNRLGSDLLRPGQRLTIRGGGGGTGDGAGRVYVVRQGDTLGSIASRHRVTLARLLRANDLDRRSTIYPGQRLTIPR